MMEKFIIVFLLMCLGWATGLILGLNVTSIVEAEYKTLKSECESNLPRNQECTMTFIAPKKLSSNKTTTEVGHSIPK